VFSSLSGSKQKDAWVLRLNFQVVADNFQVPVLDTEKRTSFSGQIFGGEEDRTRFPPYKSNEEKVKDDLRTFKLLSSTFKYWSLYRKKYII